MPLGGMGVSDVSLGTLLISDDSFEVSAFHKLHYA